ncbi:MAG TPA: nucleoside kinase [Bellilinea sp.]|nr:nucleoside kinase [Bellilinea sp.]
MKTEFKESSLRSTVQIQLPTGKVITGPRGATVGSFLNILPEAGDKQIVGAVVNYELRELTFPIQIDSYVSPVLVSSSDGARIYRRSLTFLLQAAFADLYPDAEVTVDHSVSSGGYYCTVQGVRKVTKGMLAKLTARMRKMVRQDIPFTKYIIPIADALKEFQEQGYEDKALLMRFRKKDTLVMYELEGYRDYFHGYMVPSTGYLYLFQLVLAGEGFVMQYPRRHAVDQLQAIPETEKLLKTFRQYGAWLTRIGIENVGQLDLSIEQGNVREIILISEALQEQQISNIAQKIADRSDKARIVLLAGPSSSGKTTTSKRLSVQLLARGLSPYALELDNYFVDRSKTPRDENGDYDYESLKALDIDRLSKDISGLISGAEVHMPRYNFQTGQSEPGDSAKLTSDQVIILEGIHGLNPALLPSIPADQAFRLYVSCLTQLNLDRHNRISTTDSRLIRRIVRDQRERGYSALDTIGRWESVRRGEKKYIFPYQENADEMFNTALVYELSALKSYAEPLLSQVPFGKPEYIEAKRLLTLLDWFIPLDEALIPDNSILREFIGNSIFKQFKIWKL